MRKFALAGLVTLVMLMFTALAQAGGPGINMTKGTCGVFDAAGNILAVQDLDITSETDSDGNTHLYCNARLPKGAILPGDFDPGTGTTLPESPVVWDAASAAIDTAEVPQANGLVHCVIDGAGDTTSWQNIITRSGHSNLSCTFDNAGPGSGGGGGGSVARTVVLLIDEDSIDKDKPSNFFTESEVNDDIADIGQRAQLRYFADAAAGWKPDVITLRTGEVGDEGWFALETIPPEWDGTGPTDDGLRNFVGVPVGDGLGGGSDPEALLDKIPGVTPLRALGLKQLVGKQVCAVVYDGDISMNYDPLDGSLKGANSGTVAVEVISVAKADENVHESVSSSTLPIVEIRILNAVELCRGPLDLFDAPEPPSSSEPFDVDPDNPTGGYLR